MDQLNAMRVFARVAESGSFADAARRLDISTTAASRAVANLEDLLGARLLHRTTRRLNLTESGAIYLQHCVRILGEIDEANASVGPDTFRPRGTLRIAVPAGFGVAGWPRLIVEFRKAYPDVGLDIVLVNRLVDLIEEGYDLSIYISETLDPSMVARTLMPVHLILCAAPAYLEQYGEPRVPEDLAAHHCIASTFADQSRAWTFTAADGRKVRVPLRSSLRANESELMRALAVAGEGIVRLPTFLVDEDLKKGTLVRLLSDWQTPPYTMYAVYPSGRHLSAKVRAFVEFMQAHWPGIPVELRSGYRPAK